MSDESKLNKKEIVYAKDILSKIGRKEPIEYRQAIIVGDLDLDDLDLPKIPVERSKEEIRFLESDYGLSLGFDANLKIVVLSPIEFYDCRIEGKINFSNAIFFDSINFDHTSVGEASYFYFSEFYGSEINFDFTRFGDEVIFNFAKFHNDLSFQFSKLEVGVSFENAEFCKESNFMGSMMIDIGHFIDAIFRGNADFRATNFERFSNFEGARFWRAADFAEAGFQGTAFFNRVHFHDNVSLKKARIYNMEFYPNCSDNSRIYLNDSNIMRIKMDWRMIKQHIVYDSSVYLALVENFNRQALFDYADDCYFEYNLKTNKPGVKDFFMLSLCEYGIYTRNIFIWASFFILLYIMGNTVLRDYSLIGNTADKVLSWIIIPLLIVIFSKRFSK